MVMFPNLPQIVIVSIPTYSTDSAVPSYYSQVLIVYLIKIALRFRKTGNSKDTEVQMVSFSGWCLSLFICQGQ